MVALEEQVVLAVASTGQEEAWLPCMDANPAFTIATSKAAITSLSKQRLQATAFV